MTETTERRLAYGCNRIIKTGPKHTAAWGARLIWPNDVVYSRVDSYGSEEDRARLIALLTERTPAPSEYPALLARAGITQSSDAGLALYEDDDILLYASPQRSYGYLYVTALLKERG